MGYDKNLLDTALGLFGKARKRNLMGRFDEARELTSKGIHLLENSDPKRYAEILARAYFFLRDYEKFSFYLQTELDGLKAWRREYGKTDEAYQYGSRYLDARVDGLEQELDGLRTGWVTKKTEFYPKIGETSTLVAFDLDGTLLQMKGYSWDYLSRMLRISKSEEQRIRAEYRTRNIDYAEWARQILEMYKRAGLNRRHLEELASKISLVPGARETIEELKKRGKKIALISGSLDFLVNAFFPAGTFDHVHINKVFFDERGNLIRSETTPYGDGMYKRQGLLEICEPKKIISYVPNENWEKIHEEWKDHLDIMYGEWGPDDDGLTKVITDYPGYQHNRTIYVGDNNNDVEAAESAGMAIAVNSKSEKLKNVCEVSVDGDLRSILECIG